MKKFNIFAVLLLAMLIVTTLTSPMVMALAEPEVASDTVLLVETISGKILYEKNKNLHVAPGDITKVMTLLLAVEAVEDERVKLNDEITASETFLDGIGKDDATQKIMPGEKLRFEDLLFCLFLASANDASNIVAEVVDGSVSSFVDRMNEKAYELGCKDTQFMNTGGLAEPGQYTSSWDQYQIFKEAIAHPLFLKIASTVSFGLSATEYSPERNLINSNTMLQSSGAYYYKYCIAGKTGSPSEDSNSFVAYSKNSNLSLISVIFGAESVEADVSIANQCLAETIRLFEWGFPSFVWQDIISKNDIVVTEKIALAKGTDIIDLKPYDTLTILARSDLKEEDIKRDIVIYGQADGEGLSAPVKEGDILGKMTVYVDGVMNARINLVAADNVEIDRARFIKAQISTTLSEFWVQFIIFIVLLLTVMYIWIVIRDRKVRREKKRKLDEVKKEIIEARRRQKLFK